MLPTVIPFSSKSLPKLLLSASRLRKHSIAMLELSQFRERLNELEKLLATEQVEIERLLAAGAEIEND